MARREEEGLVPLNLGEGGWFREPPVDRDALQKKMPFEVSPRRGGRVVSLTAFRICF